MHHFAPPKRKFHMLTSQAEVVLHKFGGATRLYLVLLSLGYRYNKASIYKWTYPRERGGTGGIIPTAAWTEILHAARVEGITIEPEDIDPRRTMSLRESSKSCIGAQHLGAAVLGEDPNRFESLTGKRVNRRVRFRKFVPKVLEPKVFSTGDMGPKPNPDEDDIFS